MLQTPELSYMTDDGAPSKGVDLHRGVRPLIAAAALRNKAHDRVTVLVVKPALHECQAVLSRYILTTELSPHSLDVNDELAIAVVVPGTFSQSLPCAKSQHQSHRYQLNTRKD